MSYVDRRRFVQVSAAAAAVATFTPLSSNAHHREGDRSTDRPKHPVEPVVHRLAIQPGLVENLDDPTSASLWAFNNLSPEDAELVTMPTVLDEATILSVASEEPISETMDRTTIAVLRALGRANTIGGYNSSELSSTILAGVLLDRDFDVALEFYVPHSAADIVIDHLAGLPVMVGFDTAVPRVNPLETPFRNITVGAWRIQFRPNHPPGKGHKMGSCAPTGSPHIHFDICYNRYGTRWEVLNTLHVGKYSQSGKKCAFVSNDPEKSSRPFCKKICIPTQRDLQRMYESALAAAAAAAGIAIAAWLLASMASAAAAATFVAVLAL